jgi:misacylated tRNA(Ala) deacylase
VSGQTGAPGASGPGDPAPATRRLYWEDAYRAGFRATVEAVADGWCALSETTFYPGGGGQPADTGVLTAGAAAAEVTAVRCSAGLVWHRAALPLAAGQAVGGRIDWPRRYQLMRYHTLLHLVNTVMLDAWGALITGADIGVAQARIDFAVEAPLREVTSAVEGRVNQIIAAALACSAAFVPEAELAANPRLVRTLRVAPPVEDGRVRTLEIAGFDVQACGGTHVHSTAELGRCRVTRVDNKGKHNKRVYVSLE